MLEFAAVIPSSPFGPCVVVDMSTPRAPKTAVKDDSSAQRRAKTASPQGNQLLYYRASARVHDFGVVRVKLVSPQMRKHRACFINTARTKSRSLGSRRDRHQMRVRSRRSLGI